ncbi:hypothetical protein CU098_005390 [Rhizopus stolonifer]|uniref:Uncharacterized protein n=1 Tax=Rhizopus stolonifer TaxID=4846 RepID=A0A367JE54_RHIST|nr:hypothetical protein CU098_005390 [Rhizopus stolonifer]
MRRILHFPLPMTHEQDRLAIWHDICIKSFNQEPVEVDFVKHVLFEHKTTENSCTWKTHRKEFQHYFKQLDFVTTDNMTFTLSADELTLLRQERDKTRSYWHFHHRVQARRQIANLVHQMKSPLDMTQAERIQSVKEFVDTFGRDVTARSLFCGLSRLLYYQLNNKYVVEWNAPEAIFVDNDESKLPAYIRFLSSILGIDIVCQDQDPYSDIPAAPLTSDYNTMMSAQHEYSYQLRMSAYIADQFIKKVLYYIPKDLRAKDMNQELHVTDVLRLQQQRKTLCQRILDFLKRFFSFFKRH